MTWQDTTITIAVLALSYALIPQIILSYKQTKIPHITSNRSNNDNRNGNHSYHIPHPKPHSLINHELHRGNSLDNNPNPINNLQKSIVNNLNLLIRLKNPHNLTLQISNLTFSKRTNRIPFNI